MYRKIQKQFEQALRIYDRILNAVSNRNYDRAKFLLKGLELVKEDMETTIKRKEIIQ